MYAELHAKSNFSFLEGASHPDELVERAAVLGYAALAITDRNSLAGVVRAHVAAKAAGLKLLIGAEITPADATPVVLLATDRAAYGRLARLITRGRRQAAKGQCYLTFDDVADHAAGLLALVAEESPSFPCLSLRAAPSALRTASLGRYRELFGDRCYALAELHQGPDDARRLEELAQLSHKTQVPLVAAGDVHYHEPRRRYLHDVLTATRLGLSVAEAAGQLFPNAQRHLKSPEEMAARFASLPEALARTIEIAGRATFSLDELRYEYPEELAPPGRTPLEQLAKLTWEGAARRYPRGTPAKVRGLIEHELTLIEQLKYEAYFLTVWDLVRFARSRGILCQGRGSAANSAVCYCLEVTSVDPERIDVLFERFISRERNEAPDIDVDFEHERREEVLQYVYEKYGRDRAGMTAEVIRYRPRSAVRDVGKALGLSLEQVDALAKTLDHTATSEQFAARFREAGFNPRSTLGRRLIDLTCQLLGFPRHLSQHVGGMVITRGPLSELVPIENAAMPGRTVIQWDKYDLDALGILKVDCLALGMLTAIRKCFEFLNSTAATPLTPVVSRSPDRDTRPDRRSPPPVSRSGAATPLELATVPAEDPAVYGMIQKADTTGVFQIESRAQMSMLPRLKPRCFYDLVIEVAIVRPGPIQGNMVHPFLRRRAGEEPVEYPNDAVRAVLEKTLGVPIFQEQAMRLAVVAAGFTPGEADALRRAMGAWRKTGVIEQFRLKLLSGMRANGLSEDFSQRVFQQIKGFGEYGFPESHAASFALLVYVSAWLKHYHPAAFTASLLNSQPMGFYAPAQLVRDAREHGVQVRPVDVNVSGWDCRLEPSYRHSRAGGKPETFEQQESERQKSPDPVLRLGFRMLKGLPREMVKRIEEERRAGPYRSLTDFTNRTGLGRASLVRLAKADAFGTLGLNRRQALWQSLAQERALPLFVQLEEQGSGPFYADDPPVALPGMHLAEEVAADYQTAGLSLRAHPLKFVRPLLDEQRVAPASRLARLPHGRRVQVAGLVLLRQRPSTANGITFVTLEDETGVANLVVLPAIWERFRTIARASPAWIAHGFVERKGDVIHVQVRRLEDLSSSLDGLRCQSRDFR